MFKGVIVPLITPFKEDYTIDYNALKWLIQYLVSRGVNGLFPVSTTGEFIHLSFEEKIAITKIVVEEVGGKTKIIPGASENTTLMVLRLAKEYADLGVDGIVVTPPYYFKYDSDGLWRHYSIIAEKTDLPILMYNIPSLTGNNIPVELIMKLAKEYSNIVGIKVTYDSLSYMRRLILAVKQERKNFSVLTGSSDYLLPTLILGGDGGVLALAHIAPRICTDVVKAWNDREYEKAFDLYIKLSMLSELYDVATSIPSMIKTALKLLDTPIKPIVRPPLRPESEENVQKIEEILRRVGIENLM